MTNRDPEHALARELIAAGADPDQPVQSMRGSIGCSIDMAQPLGEDGRSDRWSEDDGGLRLRKWVPFPAAGQSKAALDAVGGERSRSPLLVREAFFGGAWTSRM